MLSCRKVMDHNYSTSNFGGSKLKLQLKSPGWVCAKTSRRRRKFCCASCGGIFQSSFKLQRHIKLQHASERPLPGLDSRKRSHAKKSTPERKYSCNLCPKVTTTAKKLRDHKRIHNDRNFSCNYCSKKFTLLNYLNRHIEEVHLKLQRFKCNDCGRGFTHKHNFDRHRNVHNSTFDFTCAVCGRPFIRKDNMTRHNKSHKTHEFKRHFYPTDQT